MKVLLKELSEKAGLNLSSPKSGIEKKLFRLLHRFFYPLKTIPERDYKIEDNSILLKKFNINIPLDKEHDILMRYTDALTIVNLKKGKFYFDPDKNLRLDIDGIKFIINDAEELSIINEVFIDGVYNVLNTPQDSVLIDIGMNVGIASLFFASKENFSTCYSYEIFPETYRLALQNIHLNSSGKKINAFPYGLGKEDATLTLQYSLKSKGRMGINALTAHYDKLIPQEVSIKKATHVFREISIKSQGKFIVCKMDCEGSEFDIIEDLYSNNMLLMVNVYMIEWHDRFPAKIITQLSENNYLIFNFTSKNGHVGMIYAIRK